jgi:glyoxylase-like metal-dependent hydrolase (beta-lactamase superfamily II)
MNTHIRSQHAAMQAAFGPRERVTRRRLMHLATLIGGVALACPGARRSAPEVAAAQATPAVAGGTLYTFDSGESGFFTKTFFYDTGSQVVAFDAQITPDIAKKALDYLTSQTDSPLTYLVITHPNPDKFNGAPAFQDAGAKVIASAATAAAIPEVHEYKKAFFVGSGMFTEETYPKLVTVDETFSGKRTLELGNGQTVELVELSEPGVSSTQTVAYIPELNALIVGDLVHHKMHAWLEGGIVDGKATPTIDGWIADLRELETMFGDKEPTVYGGRGEAVPLSVGVADQIAYLEKADRIVTDYVASLGDKKSELSGPKANEHYAAIQAEIAKAFPDYAFPDMIGFSVYGLVNSKL